MNNRLNTIKVSQIRELKDNEKIQVGDFLQFLTIEEFEEAGEEITELVEKFAGKMVEVLEVGGEYNEFHELEFFVRDEEDNMVSGTSHEFSKAYREKEHAEIK